MGFAAVAAGDLLLGAFTGLVGTCAFATAILFATRRLGSPLIALETLLDLQTLRIEPNIIDL